MEVVDVHQAWLCAHPLDWFNAIRSHIRKIFFGFRLKECFQGEDIGSRNRAVLTDPHFSVQAIRGKFFCLRPPPPSLPAGFAFCIKNSLVAIRDQKSADLLRAQWMCEYECADLVGGNQNE